MRPKSLTAALGFAPPALEQPVQTLGVASGCQGENAPAALTESRCGSPVERRGAHASAKGAVLMVAPAMPVPPDSEGAHQPAVPAAGLPLQLDRLMPGLRLLVVDADSATAVIVRDALGAKEAKIPARRPPSARGEPVGIEVYAASSVAEAATSLKRMRARGEPVHLVVAEHKLPDGAGLDLLRAIDEARGESQLILTGPSSCLEIGLEAFRRGALDFLPKPLDRGSLALRLRTAAGRRYLHLKDQRRLQRLKRALRQLNRARRTVGQKVDLLCQDLVGAYSDLARQVERIRVGGHLTKLLESASDLEQLLCHMMDWILREVGHCNIAIYLTDHDGKNELGAYMKHTVAGTDRVCEWLAKNVIPRINAAGFLHAGDKPLAAKHEPKGLAGQTVLGVECAYLAESLASVIVFRSAERPFTGDDLALLKASGPVFATALTALIRQAEAEDKKKDAEDEWWRRGEESE